MSDPETFVRYRVAHALHKTQGEMDDMSFAELTHWCAYLEMMDDAARRG